MWDIILCDIIPSEINSFGCAFVCPPSRENILVLDIFFEALNYEKIEQKKAYEIAGLLGKILKVFRFTVTEKCNWPQCQHSRWCPHRTLHIVCSLCPVLWGFPPLWTEIGGTHFHNLMLLQGQLGWAWWEVGAGWTLLTILPRLLWEILNWKWQHGEWFHAPLFNYCTCAYLLISFALGDIGGQMGLFIGASVLTILEIFDYLYEVSDGFKLLKCKTLNTYSMYSCPRVYKW